MAINLLSQLGVATAKVGMHADGGGLYLQVTTTGAGHLNKSWLFRYSVGGRERQMGLGSISKVKLADARQRLPSAGNSGSLSARNEERFQELVCRGCQIAR